MRRCGEVGLRTQFGLAASPSFPALDCGAGLCDLSASGRACNLLYKGVRRHRTRGALLAPVACSNLLTCQAWLPGGSRSWRSRFRSCCRRSTCARCRSDYLRIPPARLPVLLILDPVLDASHQHCWLAQPPCSHASGDFVCTSPREQRPRAPVVSVAALREDICKLLSTRNAGSDDYPETALVPWTVCRDGIRIHLMHLTHS